MTPVKLPAGSGWLCAGCAELHARRHQAIECCALPADDGFTPGDYVLLVVALSCAAFFLASLFVPGTCQTC